MLTEETKDNKTKVGCADFGCCNPEDFKKIVETKCECFSGQSDATDFSAMMKNMMGMCCGLKSEGTKMDTESQKMNLKGRRSPLKKNVVVLNC